MITSFLLQIKQPSEEDYLAAKENKEVPFALRAQVINSYRKNLLRELWGKGPERINFPRKKEKSVNAKRRYSRKDVRRLGSCNGGSVKNSYLVGIFKSVFYLTSGGRNRPSRKVKLVSKVVSKVIHLIGYKATWERQREKK